MTAQVVLDDRHLSGRGRTTLLRLSWHDQDPLAVHLFITATPDHPSLPRGHWVVSRDVLRRGLREPSGEGWVQASPDPDRDRVRFALQRDWGVCEVGVPRAPVESFLAATADVVPPGTEDTAGALDALLADLFPPSA